MPNKEHPFPTTWFDKQKALLIAYMYVYLNEICPQ